MMEINFSETLRVGKVMVFAVGLAVMLGLLLAASPAHAKTFTVNSTEDFSDIDPGDGICDTLSSKFLNPCTLRGAIQEANKFAGADTINFNIPNVAGNELKTIKPAKQLPWINETVTINGYTQPGASPNTIAQGSSNAVFKIELDGSGAGEFSRGVPIGADNSVVKGLVINRFGYVGVEISSLATGVKVQGNYIGTDPSGTSDLGNDNVGVQVTNGSNHLIGGTTPAARNLISANDFYGVYTVFSSGNVVQGNLIGTNAGGFPNLGNTVYGVFVTTSGNFIGGNTSGAANVIAGNGHHGVLISGDDVTENRILRNSISQNGLLGINLNGGIEDANFVTQNDTKDPDTGPNGLQNYPVLTSATTVSGTTTIKGTLNSTPNKTFTLRFFSNPQGAAPEGMIYLGSKSVTTNANGNTGIFTFSPAQAQTVGKVITATATNPGGNTSEFSLGKQVS